jgi:hypothetical protein
MTIYDATKSTIKAVEIEAEETCLIEGDNFQSWGSLLHVFALSNVVNKCIFSCYPDANPCLRPFYHRLISPRFDHNPSNPIHILWSRDGDLDNRPDEHFQPNHFVPILPDTHIFGTRMTALTLLTTLGTLTMLRRMMKTELKMQRWINIKTLRKQVNH